MSYINITTFSGAPNNQNFRNYVEPTQLRITSGEQIPLTAVIDEVTFTFQAKIWANVSDSFYVYDGTYDVPDNNGNYQLDSDACPRITDATTISVDSDTKSTWTFTGVTSNNERYINLKTLICETNYFTIIIGRKKYKTSGYTGYVYSDLPFSCEVKWHSLEYIPTPPTNIYFSDNSAAPGENVTLNWSASTLPADAENRIIGYSIEGYNNNSSTNSEIGGSCSPDMPYNSEYQYYFTTNTYYTFPAPTEAGTYYYRVDTIVQNLKGGIGRYTNSTVYTPLTVAISSTGSPTNLKINNVTTLYIGTTNIPILTLSWTAASAGTNNPVANYSIQKLSNSGTTTILGTTTQTSYIITDDSPEGTYYIIANPTISGYGSSLSSNSARIVKITSKPIITITSSFPNATNSNVTLTWSAASLVSGAMANYNIYKNGLILLTTTETSYTLDITTITPGSSFNLSIEPYYLTASGSYTMGEIVTTQQIVRADAFSIPTPFWTACYDKDAGYSSDIYSNVYSNVTLAWESVISENEAQGSKFIYTIEQQINNGAFSRIAQYVQAGSHSISLTNISEGSILGFRMNITNEFGVSIYSNVIQVQKIISPSINNLIISNITATSLQSSFEWTRNLAADADDLLYTIILSYGDQSYTLLENTITPSDSSPLVNTHSIALTNTSFASVMSKLKEKVITDKTVYPMGTLTVRLSYAHFTNAVNSISNSFKFNYVTTPHMGLINFISSKDFYNPGDIVTINLTDFIWYDAAGGTNGGIVTNYLTSSYSSNKFIFTDNTTLITAPTASTDLSITLTLETSITYADATKKYISSKTLSLKVARWTSEAVLVDSLIALEGNAGLEGYLQLPEQLCSSNLYNNLTTITPVLIAPTTNYTAIFYNSDGLTPNTSFTKSELAANRKMRFVLTNTTGVYSDVTATFQLTFLNTSNKTLIITTNSYRYFVADIDMAIRKGRVGINVGAEFESTNGSSTLQINAGSQTGINPIVEILSTNQSSSDNRTQFLLLQDGSIFEDNSISSAIWCDGKNIIIDHLLATEAQTANSLIEPNSKYQLILTYDQQPMLTIIKDEEFSFGFTRDAATGNIQALLIKDEVLAAETILTAENYKSYISFGNFAPNCVLTSDASGEIITSDITSTELFYLKNTQSNIQSQLDNKFESPGIKTKKYVFAAPYDVDGIPDFRPLNVVDIPDLSANKITSGTLAIEQGGTGSSIKGAASGGALYNLGIVYSENGTSSIASPEIGMICLVPKG